MRRKLLCAILTIAMCLTTLPIIAFCEIDVEPQYNEVAVKVTNYYLEGSTWKEDEEGPYYRYDTTEEPEESNYVIKEMTRENSLITDKYKFKIEYYADNTGKLTNTEVFATKQDTVNCWNSETITCYSKDGTKSASFVFSLYCPIELMRLDKLTEKWTKTSISDQRYWGNDRYETSLKVADAYKKALGTTKLFNVVLASGDNFPDALAGSFLCKEYDAPLIVVNENNKNKVVKYLEDNMVGTGEVYILGGTSAVSQSIEDAAKSKGFAVKRISGTDRYETNRKTLADGGVEDCYTVVICSGDGYADSLSASATGEPILLVNANNSKSQLEWLKTKGTDYEFIIAGGKNAVTSSIESQIKEVFGSVYIKRLAGADRYETSKMIADFFGDRNESTVFAYASNFPDGLSGAALAQAVGASIFLVDSNNTEQAETYARETLAIDFTAITLGGSGLISDSAINRIRDAAK